MRTREVSRAVQAGQTLKILLMHESCITFAQMNRTMAIRQIARVTKPKERLNLEYGIISTTL